MAIDKSSVQVNLRLPSELKLAAERAAAEDHRSLTSLIEKLLADHTRNGPTLQDWHDLGRARFLSFFDDEKHAAQIRQGSHTFSYLVRTTSGEQIRPEDLTNKLRGIYRTLNSLVGAAHIFYPYTRRDLQPHFTSDAGLRSGKTSQLLEFIGVPELLSWGQFWRVSPSGLVTNSRPHREDQDDFSKFGLETGKWFWPFSMTHGLAEIVLHAQLFSELFSSAEVVEFRCEWSGLHDRALADPESKDTWRDIHMAFGDECVTVGEWPVTDLRMSWPEIVSILGGGVMRLFDPTFDCSPEWVRGQIPRWGK